MFKANAIVLLLSILLPMVLAAAAGFVMYGLVD
jgi:hypothetical protein